MILYLIRHGESTDNAGTTPPLPAHVLDRDRQRALDAPLTEKGRQQVAATAAWLAERAVTHLYSSLMVRALQTAEILARPLRLTVHALPPLCEIRSGPDFAGLPRAEIARRFPTCHLPEEVREEGWWDRSVEDEITAYGRAQGEADRLRRVHGPTEDAVALVTHGLFGSALLSVLLGAPPCGYKRFLMGNAAVSGLEITPEGTRLVFHNFVEPIPPLLRT